MALSFRTDRSGQTVQTQMRLFLEQSGQGLNYLRHFEFGKLLTYRLVGNSEHRYSILSTAHAGAVFLAFLLVIGLL